MHADDGAVVEISQPWLQRVEFVANQVMGRDERVRRCSLNQQIQREPFVDVRQQLGGLGEFGPASGMRIDVPRLDYAFGCGSGRDRRARGIERVEVGALLRGRLRERARIGVGMGRRGFGQRAAAARRTSLAKLGAHDAMSRQFGAVNDGHFRGTRFVRSL